jgi:hypothetical protein
MAIGYRAILRLDRRQDAVAVAESHVRSWLREKQRGRRATLTSPDWDGPGHYQLGRRAALLVVHADQDAHISRRLYRLMENNDAGRWVVSLYAITAPASPDHPQTIVVEVDLLGVEREVALARVAPPKVVRAIIDTVDAGDGAISLTGTPRVIRSGETDEVLAAIVDPRRRASVTVAPSPALDLDDDWRQVVTSLTTQSVGVTASYVVFSEASAELNERLPESHRVRPGDVRTYLPGVDFSDPTDALKHKWLTPATLARSLEGRRVSEGLQRRHGELARRRFVEAELPADVRRAIDLLRRAETGVERAARVEEHVVAASPGRRHLAREGVAEPSLASPEPAPPVLSADADTRGNAWMSRAAGTIKRWLRIDAPTPAHFDQLDSFVEAKVAEINVAAEQLSEAAGREEELQSALDSLRHDRDDFEVDLAIAQDELIKTQREVTILRTRIASGQRPEDAFVPPEEEIWEAPGSVYEIVERLTPGDKAHPITSRVVFTGSPDGALDIDRRYQTGVYAGHFWRAARVLHDYAKARSEGFRGNVHMYLTDGPDDGTKCPPSQHAAGESDTTLNSPKFRDQRFFPVPTDADPSGIVLMTAHFKPAHHDRFAPRMHYYDDVASSGKVYVGYIGGHLDTKAT